MNFNSLVWYSSLAIGDEKNSYVADFLNRSCELLNEEIKEEIISQVKLKFDIFKSTNIPEKLKNIKAIKPGSRNLS